MLGAAGAPPRSSVRPTGTLPRDDPTAVLRRLRNAILAALGLRLVSQVYTARQLPKGRYAGSAVEVDTDSEWVLIVSEGEFLNHHHGPHKVTAEDIASMAAHFETTSTDLLIDYDHASVFQGDTRAAGWSTDLRVTDRGLEMRAPVFTAAAQQMLDEREYRYYSPVYQLEGREKDGSPTGSRLISVAITSLPYFDQHEIDAIGNSASGDPDDTTPPDEGTPFMEKSELLELLGLPDDATDEQIAEAKKKLKEAQAAAKKAAEEKPDEEAKANSATPEASDVDARLDRIEQMLADRAKADEDADEAAKVETLVNGALASGRIGQHEKALFTNSAKADFEGTKALIEKRDEGSAKPQRMRVNSASGGSDRTGDAARFGGGPGLDYVNKQLGTD